MTSKTEKGVLKKREKQIEQNRLKFKFSVVVVHVNLYKSIIRLNTRVGILKSNIGLYKTLDFKICIQAMGFLRLKFYRCIPISVW